jgi:hypothetical protein
MRSRDAVAQRDCPKMCRNRGLHCRVANYVRILRVFCLHSAFSRVGFEFKEIHH